MRKLIIPHFLLPLSVITLMTFSHYCSAFHALQDSKQPVSIEKFVRNFDSLYNLQEKLAFSYMDKHAPLLNERATKTPQYFSLLYKKIKYAYFNGNYFEGLEDGLKFIESYELEDKQLGKVYTLLGNSYYRLEDYTLALTFYQKSKEINEALNINNELAGNYSNLALIHEYLNNYKMALSYHKVALKLGKEHRRKAVTYSYVSLARMYVRLGDYDSSAVYLDSATYYIDKHNFPEQKARVLRASGYMFSEMQKYPLAIAAYQQSISLDQKNGNVSSALQTVCDLTLVYENILDYRTIHDLCITYLPIAQQTQNFSLITQLAQKLYTSYVQNGKFKEAVFIEQQFKHLRDSLGQLETRNSQRKAEMRLHALKNENENNLLKHQKSANEKTIKAQNILLYSIAIGLILVIAVALLIYRSYVIKNRLSLKIQLQSEKLKQLDEAKSRFFANISHDLRTPLTLIMGGLDQVLNNTEVFLTNKAERQLKTGILNGERILHLTNEINELIKLEDGKLKLHKQYINIDQMLNLLVVMFSSLAEIKGLRMSYSKSIFDGVPIIEIDPFQFEKVLFNLITNAIKHTKEGDSVTVGLNREGENIQISIIDSGEGIPEENIPYIFERYYQAPETSFKTQEGFGIGLALVKEVIAKHDATINVRSQLGKGSEFIITIPISNVATSKIANLSKLAYSDETRNLFKEIDEADIKDVPVVNINRPNGNSVKQTLLVVEDHPEIRQYIEDIISSKYQVLTASNGNRALKVLDKENVDLVITDLMMPWFDGFELLEKLREHPALRKIPVLVLSARTTEEDKQKVLSQGVNDFLCKPFNTNELLQRIENLLDHKELWDNSSSQALFINNQQTLDEVEKSLHKKIEHLILERIDDPNLSIAHLADQIAVSERKFYRMMKKLTGGTPLEFIKEVRMQWAKKILAEKKISSASELAKSIGMNNVSHFSSQFKKRFGTAPTDHISQ